MQGMQGMMASVPGNVRVSRAEFPGPDPVVEVGTRQESMVEILRRTTFSLNSGHNLLDRIEEVLFGPIPKEAGVNQPKPVGGMEGQLNDTMAAAAGLTMRLERILARIGKGD